MPAKKERQWVGTTYGSSFMHRSLVSILKVVDVRFIYIFVAIFVVPFCLFGNGAKVIYQYLRKRCGQNKWQARWNTYVNHLLFSQVVIDRFAMYAGKRFTVTVPGYEHFKLLAQQPEGFIQLSAHIGNYELAGYTLVATDKPMNALVFGGEKATVMAARGEMFENSRIKMIPITADMSHLFAINNALAEGEIVSFPADRLFGSPKSVELPFMGGKADFPIGPFQTAVMRGSEVLSVNVMKTGCRSYTIIVCPIPYDRTMPKRTQIEMLAKGYVKQLEACLRQYPTQWYNYYDFWKQ